ncbi:hypothetical protein BH10BAC4_BH10BAC4_20010 [soil metagenome]
MILAETIRAAIAEDEKNILRTLLYFDIFNYPLTESEISSFSPQAMEAEVHYSIATLLDKKIIYLIDGFYCLQNEPVIIERRKNGNRLAERKMKIARRLSKLISFFPFVRSVMLSGSISKGYMDKNSDIDYFIVTETGRLWLVRGAMAIIRRCLLFNSHKYLCTNYFIDTNNLEIEQKNIFTAIEVATLKPMTGTSIVQQFQQANKWYGEYLPNHRAEINLKEDHRTALQKIGEKMIGSKTLDRIDHWCMKKFMSRWKETYRHTMSNDDFLIAFQSAGHVSRSHPGFYQKKVLTAYNARINEFGNRFNINLDL